MPVQINGGIHTESGRGLAGVLVSNGEHVVGTDTDGGYSLQADPSAHPFVFVTVPDGFRPGGRFYYPVPDASGRVDFTLVPDSRRDQRSFSIAHITDVHLSAAKDGVVSRKMLAADLAQLAEDAAPDLIIASGDLTDRGSIAELVDYRDTIREASVPVFSLFGNHDGTEEWASLGGSRTGDSHPGDSHTCTRNFERVLGPSYYSFDWGGRHFVLCPSEDDFGATARQVLISAESHRRMLRWLWMDLTAQPPDREIVLVMHTPPSVAFLDRLSEYNVALVLYGHTHASKVFTRGKITTASAPPLCFGGLDYGPRGYRLVRFTNEGFELELRSLGDCSPVSTTDLRGNANGCLMVWERSLLAPIHRAAPIHSYGLLLLSVTDDDNRGRAGLYCLDADTGSTRWHVSTDASIKGGAAIDENGRCAVVSSTGRVYGIETRSGDVSWQADLPGYPGRWIYGSPAIRDDTVYVGGKAGYGAYDLRSGQCRWYTELNRRSQACYASPLVYDDLVIVLVPHGAEPRAGLFALRAQDGSVEWEQRLGVKQQYPTPARFGDLVVIGGDPGNLAVLQARTGEIVWQRPVLDAEYATSLAVEDERIYVATANGEARCVDLASGEVMWTFRTGRDLLDMVPFFRGARSILATPVVFRDKVIVCGCDGGLYLLDAASGECLGHTQFDAPIAAAPCMVEDGFCVGTLDGRLYRFVA